MFWHGECMDTTTNDSSTQQMMNTLFHNCVNKSNNIEIFKIVIFGAALEARIMCISWHISILICCRQACAGKCRTPTHSMLQSAPQMQNTLHVIAADILQANAEHPHI